MIELTFGTIPIDLKAVTFDVKFVLGFHQLIKFTKWTIINRNNLMAVDAHSMMPVFDSVILVSCFAVIN